MMSKLLSRLLRDKLFFALVIVALVCTLYDVAILAFDIAELVSISLSSVKLSSAFLGLNIVAIIFTALGVIFGIIYLILKKRKIYAIIPKK